MTHDMREVTAPKSDQLNADDLIGGARTITVTKVQLSPEPNSLCLFSLRETMVSHTSRASRWRG